MDDNETTQPLESVSADDTQVMPTTADPVTQSTDPGGGEGPGSGGDSPGEGVGAPPKAGAARAWFAVAVVAVLLAAVGVGVYLGTRDEAEPKVAVVTEAETDAETVVVPDLRGMTLERATQDAEATGLVIGDTATAVVDASVTPAGTVLSQDPLPGAEVEPGAVITLVIAEAAAQPPAADSGTSGGSSSSDDVPADVPEAPEDVTVEDISRLQVVPRPIDLGLIQLQQWTTVLEHTGTAEQWTSGTLTLGSGDKRILLTADGPSGYLVAVWSWDAVNDTDWQLESIVVSQPGGASFETALDAPAGNHTFMVKSNNTAVLWKVTVQEKK